MLSTNKHFTISAPHTYSHATAFTLISDTAALRQNEKGIHPLGGPNVLSPAQHADLLLSGALTKTFGVTNGGWHLQCSTPHLQSTRSRMRELGRTCAIVP
jgi:hypothetical protein